MPSQRLTRRQMVATLGGAAVAAGARRSRASQPKPRRPNIIYIMTDDHAAHAVGCYGSKINQTPNLDRIARDGMRFANCFVTNALCGPSRATLLTGKYSHLNGVVNNSTRFDGSQQTFPKLLQQAGYRTALIGKWHLQSDPTGFDYWNILPGQGRYHDPVLIEMGEKKILKGYVTDVITDLSIEFLEKSRNAPFCLLYHHKAPHRSWEPDEKHANLYEDRDIPLPPTFDDDWKTRASAAQNQEMTVAKHLNKTDLKADPPSGLSPEQEKKWRYQRFIKDYLRTVASVDDNVGRLLDYLDRSGLTENTVVIYTSDNGFFLGDHGWFDKRFMYEESLRIPLLVRYPAEIKAGSTADHFAVNADYAPTILDFAGVAIPPDMQGRSLRPLLRGEKPRDWRTSMYYHYYEFPAAHSVQPHYGVRTDRHKLIHYYKVDEWELFDLEKDPRELKNVYGDPGYADTVKRLKTELDRLRKELKDTT